MKEYTVTVHGRSLRVVQHDDGTFDVPEKGEMPAGGSALKPAHEPIVMARKPMVGTLGRNVLTFGTGALNIDGTRIGTTVETWPKSRSFAPGISSGYTEGREKGPTQATGDAPAGRWPSNVLLSDPELFDSPNPYVVGSGATTTSGGLKPYTEKHDNPSSYGFQRDKTYTSPPDSGGYSRFFLIPKADRAERERGLAGRDKSFTPTMNDGIGGREHSPDDPRAYRANSHPTVKPIDLMRHLVRLVTPPGGVTLDPFAGSGTTGLAASEEGFRAILIEREPEYVEIIVGRLMATPMGLGLDVPATVRKAPKTGGVIVRKTPQGADVGMYSPGVRPVGEVVGYADGYRPSPKPEKPKADTAPMWDDEEPAA